MTRNVFPGNLKPEDLGTSGDGEVEIWCKVSSRILQAMCEICSCQCLPVDEGLEGCGADCENRARRVECRQEYCRVGEGCQNMVGICDFFKSPIVILMLQAIANGWSERVVTKQGKLVAMEALPAGTFLAQYTGEVLNKGELESRMANVYQKGQTLYMQPLGKTAVVDATKKGSIARLGVHSCDPSAEVKPWLVEVKPSHHVTCDMLCKMAN